jgi:hypothetical protein
MSSAVFGQASNQQSSPCTVASLNGTYGFLRIGQTTQGPLTALGWITFDGEGNDVARQTIVRSGKVTPPAGPGGASKYTVNPDCTGTQYGLGTSTDVFSQMAVIHDGSEALALSMTVGNNVAVHYERMDDELHRAADRACSIATLNGLYGVQRNGQISGAQVTMVGSANFDGHGSLTITESGTTAGVFGAIGTQSFMYDISPDCTGTQTAPDGGVALLIVVHDGSQVLGLSTVAGSNIALHYERVTDPPTRITIDRQCRNLAREP